MSLIAEVQFSSPDLPLMEALAAVPAMRLTAEQLIADDPHRPTLFLWASGDDFETFERAVAEDETIDGIEVIESVDDRRLYRIEISGTSEAVIYPADVEVGASRLAASVTHEGISARIRFPDRDAFVAYRDICLDQDVSMDVRGLYASDDSGPAEGVYGLSPKQRRTLVRAVESGYFDIPRETDLTGLADDLGVSRQATSERLRRGTAALVCHTLDADGAERGRFGD